MRQLARTIRSALVLAFLALPAASAQRDGVPSVAIVFPDRNVLLKDVRTYDGFSKAVSALVGGELSSNYGLLVVDREQVRALVGTVPVDRETAVRIGALVHAQHSVYGSFTADESGNLRVDVRAVNVATGAVEYTDRVQDRADNLIPLVHRLAARLATGMQLSSLSAGHVAPILPESLPLKYVLLYGQGLDLADRGDRGGAAAAFNAVLADFPAFMPARAALGRLR